MIEGLSVSQKVRDKRYKLVARVALAQLLGFRTTLCLSKCCFFVRQLVLLTLFRELVLS